MPKEASPLLQRCLCLSFLKSYDCFNVRNHLHAPRGGSTKFTCCLTNAVKSEPCTCGVRRACWCCGTTEHASQKAKPVRNKKTGWRQRGRWVGGRRRTVMVTRRDATAVIILCAPQGTRVGSHTVERSETHKNKKKHRLIHAAGSVHILVLTVWNLCRLSANAAIIKPRVSKIRSHWSKSQFCICNWSLKAQSGRFCDTWW